MRKWFGLLAAVALVACAAQPKMVWLRLDGQSGRDNPALAQKYEVDRLACLGETQKANMAGGMTYCQGIAGCAIAGAIKDQQAGDVVKGCMADRGYLQVPEQEAAARAEVLRQQAAAAAAQTPVPRQQTAKR